MNNYNNIPQDLKKFNQWVCYKLVFNQNKGKNDKIPKNPYNGSNAKSNDRSTWSNFDTAFNAVQRYKFDGIGFMLDNGICGVDLDNVLDDNLQPDNKTIDIVNTLDSYTEISPSGKGLHVLCFGEIPEGRRRRDNIEMYSEGRFFTVTGRVIGKQQKIIKERTKELKLIHERYINKKEKVSDPSQKTETQSKKVYKFTKSKGDSVLNSISDKKLISKAFNSKNGIIFKNLWEGDISNYASQSEADLALCTILAFWCSNDPHRIDDLFRQSALYRHDKWDYMRGNSTYGQKTINLAIKSNKHTYNFKEHKKSFKLNNEEFEFLDEHFMERYLEDQGISVRYDVINRTVKIDGFTNKYGSEDMQNIFVIVLHDRLKTHLKFCNKETIQDLLATIAYTNQFNPVLEMLSSDKWDGLDRLEEFYDMLYISKTDTLSRTLLFKWMHQALSMAKNNEQDTYGADGILVLQGKQGIGKTTLVEKLAVNRKLCKLGQYIDPRDKDTYRRCCTSWIVELGEIETTLKSDLERMKAFITAPVDQYRLPYARNDKVVSRRTVMIGTCNTERFLVDPTGSRRFWTVPLKKIDLDRVHKFDFLQLWIQLEEMTKDNRQGFRLDQETMKQLSRRNTEHEKLMRGQIEIEDILSDSRFEWCDVTVTEFKDAHAALAKYSVEQISAVLNKLGIEQKRKKLRIDNKDIQKKIRNLPV